MGWVQGAMVDLLNMDVFMMYAYIQNEKSKNKQSWIYRNYLFIVTYMFHGYKATYRKTNDIYIYIYTYIVADLYKGRFICMACNSKVTYILILRSWYS